MSDGPESRYRSPWGEPIGVTDAQRAQAHLAFLALSDYAGQRSTGQEFPDAMREQFSMVETYFGLSVRAAAEGLEGDARETFIKDGLKAQGKIDSEDPTKADEGFKIISEGYELNRDHWDIILGRIRRGRNDLKDI